MSSNLQQAHSEITREQAIALVSGDLGLEMAKFPVRFCKPVFFGLPPSPIHPSYINNGTVTLINFRGALLAVTCCHVIEAYRQKRAEDINTFFAIASCHIDPLNQIIAEDNATDVVVIRLTAEQAAIITQNNNGIGETFYQLTAWPPQPVRANDFVAYAGFPGQLRVFISFDEISFGSYSSGACRVTDTHADYLACEFERQYWITSFVENEPESLGGLSGGPAFVIRHSPAGIISYEFAGIIYKMHESTESLYIRDAQAVLSGVL